VDAATPLIAIKATIVEATNPTSGAATRVRGSVRRGGDGVHDLRGLFGDDARLFE
jgi:hypothetical protein